MKFLANDMTAAWRFLAELKRNGASGCIVGETPTGKIRITSPASSKTWFHVVKIFVRAEEAKKQAEAREDKLLMKQEDLI